MILQLLRQIIEKKPPPVTEEELRQDAREIAEAQARMEQLDAELRTLER